MKTKTAILLIIIFLLIISPSCTKEEGFEVAFYMYGEENVTVDYGGKYIDEGAYLSINGEDLSDKINVLNTLDTNKIGTYNIDYFYNEMFTSRTVTVADISPPVIKLNDDMTKYLDIDSDFVPSEYTAVDNYDGNVTDLVEVNHNVNTAKEGTYQVEYSVVDSFDNTTLITQEIIVEASMLSSSTEDFNLDEMYKDTILDEMILDDATSEEYINETIFIGDSRSCYFIWYDFISSANGWGAQSLTPLNINSMKINKFFTKEEDYAINLIRDFQPKRIIFTMGVDCVGSSDPQVIVDSYRAFLDQVMSVSPDTLVVVNNLLPVDSTMDTENTETFLPDNNKINKVNYFLLEMCADLGVKYLNSAPVLKDENGLGKSEYFIEDKFHLTYEGQKLVFDYILSHPYIEE